ncbi:hypothetical protein EG329_013738 [Mollisiaceae sp. DMI_Dod_QoI]|nr:hypothetical protein EG329_013738 [Helotiales sp. DMI_Dod_QoI]
MAVMTRKRKASSECSEDVKPSKSPRIRLVHIPTKAKPAPSFLGDQTIVTIDLESPSASASIPVHKNFITHYSHFFAAHFSTATNLKVADVTPSTFNIFLSWLYTQTVSQPNQLSRPDINVLISLWLLADRFLVSQLQNQIMAMIFEKSFSGYIVRESFWEVFEKTERGNKMRTFLVDGFVRKMQAGDLSRDADGECSYEWLPREMLEDVLVEIKSYGSGPVFLPTSRPDITDINVNGAFKSPKFRDTIAERLSGAVKIATVTYDEMGKIGEDPSYANLDITTINEHAFLYTWKGSESALKPLLFMCHSDVVPASDSTADRWTHPPFSGYYDGTYIWGRGSADDKCNVISKLSAIEALLEVGFQPNRTVIVALGFDEESGSKGYGARCLANHLLQTYGADGIEIILDEGTEGVQNRWGTNFALPASAEKGHVDISVTIDMAGGHSSTPPNHTTIGYLAQIIQKIEENQFPSRLTNKNPTEAYLHTAALHAKNMDKNLRHAILDPQSVDKVIEYLDGDRLTRALVQTTTAVDIVQGGVKANALPESASVLVCHRIAVEESVQHVKDHYSRILEPFAKKWGLELQNSHENEKDLTDAMIWKSDRMKITVTSDPGLEPSPASDISDERFGWLAGTLRGNTDTKFYWELTNQIYRINPYSSKWDPRGLMIHTVDERMPVDGMLEMVRFYHELIRVVDEKRL